MSPYYQTNDTPEKCVKSLKKSGKLTVVIVGILLGVGLLLFGNRLVSRDSTPAADSTEPGAEVRAVEEYRLALERRVADITAEVAGAGSVSVVVTLEGGYEYVYAYDKKVTVGGESTTYITVGSGDDESLVFLCERAPAIVGIGVVCSGGGNITVRQEIIALLSAAFDVPTNKIYVAGRRSSHIPSAENIR